MGGHSRTWRSQIGLPVAPCRDFAEAASVDHINRETPHFAGAASACGIRYPAYLPLPATRAPFVLDQTSPRTKRVIGRSSLVITKGERHAKGK
jgi:hypothetical protein